MAQLGPTDPDHAIDPLQDQTLAAGSDARRQPRAGERSSNTVAVTDFLTRPERSSAHRSAASERRTRPSAAGRRGRQPGRVAPPRSGSGSSIVRRPAGASGPREAAKQMAPKGRGGAAAHVFQRQPLAEPALRHRGTTRTNAREPMASPIFQANGPAKDAKGVAAPAGAVNCPLRGSPRSALTGPHRTAPIRAPAHAGPVVPQAGATRPNSRGKAAAAVVRLHRIAAQ